MYYQKSISSKEYETVEAATTKIEEWLKATPLSFFQQKKDLEFFVSKFKPLYEANTRKKNLSF